MNKITLACGMVLLTAVLSGCGGGNTDPGNTDTGNTDTGNTDNSGLFFGQALFDLDCSSCHAANGEGNAALGGDITGKSAASITSHISTVALMNQFSVLTIEQIDSLETYIAATSTGTDNSNNGGGTDTGGDTGAPDGVALFEAHCGSCHKGNGMGTGSVHDVTNHDAAEIKREIAAVPSMQNLSFLSDAQIDAIAEALVGAGGGGFVFPGF